MKVFSGYTRSCEGFQERGQSSFINLNSELRVIYTMASIFMVYQEKKQSMTQQLSDRNICKSVKRKGPQKLPYQIQISRHPIFLFSLLDRSFAIYLCSNDFSSFVMYRRSKKKLLLPHRHRLPETQPLEIGHLPNLPSQKQPPMVNRW